MRQKYLIYVTIIPLKIVVIKFITVLANYVMAWNLKTEEKGNKYRTCC